MLKRRLVLSLLIRNDGVFVNSRRFRLQAIGELAWIREYLDFDSIDELVILNVDRATKNINSFARRITEMGQKCFVPIAAGGGVRSTQDFDLLLGSGADKVVVNTSAHDRPEFVTEMAKRYGSQCVVVSMDCSVGADGSYMCFSRNGAVPTGRDAVSWARQMESRGAGEILLKSIDRDGGGAGYDLDLVRSVVAATSIPVIASGGAGTFNHLVEGITLGDASAVAAGNLFHYIGHGLKKAKAQMRDQGVDFPVWNFM